MSVAAKAVEHTGQRQWNAQGKGSGTHTGQRQWNTQGKGSGNTQGKGSGNTQGKGSVFTGPNGPAMLRNRHMARSCGLG